MVNKVLGAFDIMTAIFLFLPGIPDVTAFFATYLFVKSMATFVTGAPYTYLITDFPAIIDLAASILLFFNFMPTVQIFVGFALLLKGIFSMF